MLNCLFKIFKNNTKEEEGVSTMYRVRLNWEDHKSQKGAFRTLNSAIDLVNINIGYKVFDKDGNQVYPIIEVNSSNEVNDLVSIIGVPQVSSQQMGNYLLSKNPSPKINLTAVEFATLFIEEGIVEGVRGDIAFCQAIHETGWFKYGGQVLPEQNNYAGIGATNNSPVGKGAWFKDEREGVRAQIQHLKAYANKETLVNKCVDPRFHLVTRGVAPNWVDLNGRWAVPGSTYGQSILAQYSILQNFAMEHPEDIKSEIEDVIKDYDYNKLSKELHAIKEKLKEIITDISY